MFVPRYDEEELRAIVQRSTNMTEVLRALKLRPAGGNHAELKKWVARWGISTEHFDPDLRRHRGLRRTVVPLATYMVAGSTYSRSTLKRRLYAEGLKERRCELCGQDEEWQGGRMALILDHINGVADDHRLENLRIVCPNCAATLDTHCGRNSTTVIERACLRCGTDFRPASNRQRYCGRECGQRRNGSTAGVSRPQTRKVVRPPADELLRQVADLGWAGTGRLHGVSDNAVRKWMRAYERDGSAHRAAAAPRAADVVAAAGDAPAPELATTEEAAPAGAPQGHSAG